MGLAPTLTALDQLRAMLLGQCITTVCISDWWTLGLSTNPVRYLVAQDILGADNDLTRAALTTGPVDLLAAAVDPEVITAAVTVLRCTLRRITAVSLADDGALTLDFEHGDEMCLRTDTDIVDWYWAVNEDGREPYRSYLVACFDRGRVNVAG